MACKAYKEDGTCSHFKEKVVKCPVPKHARDVFGDMNACKPIAEKMGIDQYAV